MVDVSRIEELLDARAATPEELLQTSPFDVPQAIAVRVVYVSREVVPSSTRDFHVPLSGAKGLQERLGAHSLGLCLTPGKRRTER